MTEQRDYFPDGPFTMEMQVLAVGEFEGETATAQVTFDIRPGALPTAEWLEKAAANAKAALPDGFRFMTRQEFANHMATERTGVKCSLPVSAAPFKISAFAAGESD